ncbi:hypothetical protein [Methanoculleus chikugoensis]|uniref:hypothetical protein n=1 Tax=Methanoculleus chikugoensis TaxID=118126 RepID=UPI000B1E78F4|nr:hypothetical protein [Methanoculleus chikugoensis]
MPPLMRFQTGVNLKEASFTVKAERLGGLAVLEGNEKEIERLKPEIGGEMVDHLPPGRSTSSRRWKSGWTRCSPVRSGRVSRLRTLPGLSGGISPRS